MARRTRSNRRASTDTGFRFEWVQWGEQQLAELRGFAGNHKDSLEITLRHLAEAGWKISLSENQRTGRILASITDKWERPGCKGVAWGIEHSDIVSAVVGAFYYATEIIGNGIPEGEPEHLDDLW